MIHFHSGVHKVFQSEVKLILQKIDKTKYSFKEKMIQDYPIIKEKLIAFIKKKVDESGSEGVVLGLSGGIDSTLTAYLSVEALGSGNVMGLLLPEKGITSEKDVKDALEVVTLLGVEHKVIEINEVLTSFSSIIQGYDKDNMLVNGNLKARTRMCILYYHANLLRRMVIGTGNRTEMLLGYFTKFGDGGVDLEPLGNLYKTQVRGLARYMNIPPQIIDKTPTAGLWPDQTDEGELGVTYEEADRILSMLTDEKREISDIRRVFPREHVDRLASLLHANRHKRMPPESCDI
jgi:NAD+ synthase